MNFCSDNVTGVAPEIMAAIEEANAGAAMGYGADAVTGRLEGLFAELFERPVAVFPLATGTAANALALSVLVPPYGVVYAHPDAHIHVDECGAPEFYTGGGKLVAVPGPDGKVPPDALEAILAVAGKGVVHHAQPAAVSLSQVNEWGTVYTVEEVAALAEVAGRHGLALHMDGARFANAVAALGCAPADVTWRAGVDVLSFGATKNGAMAAEAVVFFDPGRAGDFAYRRKRAGHLFSKMRFLSAQLEAYLRDGLWLRLAAHANAMAARLAAGLAEVPDARLLHPVDANEIFVALTPAAIAGAEADGFRFYPWGPPGDHAIRLVTAFDTRPEDVDALLASFRRHGAAGAGRRTA